MKNKERTQYRNNNNNYNNNASHQVDAHTLSPPPPPPTQCFGPLVFRPELFRIELLQHHHGEVMI
jgi:hypothetical protein